jgi:hypothetical protein
MWHHIKREQAIELRLGKRLDVTAPSEPVEHVASAKAFRSFGSLAPPGSDRSASQARQRSTGPTVSAHGVPGGPGAHGVSLQLSCATRCTANETKLFKGVNMQTKIIDFPPTTSTASRLALRTAVLHTADRADWLLAVWLGVWAVYATVECIGQLGFLKVY